MDTFTVKICQPHDESWHYLIGTNRWGLKYEIVAAIGVPRICWISGPWMGNASDPTIATQSGILNEIRDGEVLMTDKIYRGDRFSFLVPLPGHRTSLPGEDNAFNYLIYCVRQTVERVICRLKNFGFFAIIWHFSISLHALCVHAAAKLCNLFLLFEPLG